MSTNLNDIFGPCGLLCEKCFAYESGPIRQHAKKLRFDLGGFDNYANRFVSLLEAPIFKKYPDFKDLLDFLSSSSCQGCRKQACHLFKDCKVKQCFLEKNVDYCYQCADFP